MLFGKLIDTKLEPDMEFESYLSCEKEFVKIDVKFLEGFLRFFYDPTHVSCEFE